MALAAFNCLRNEALCERQRAMQRISRAPRNKVKVRSQKVVPACSYWTIGWYWAACVSRTLNSLNRPSSFSIFLSTNSRTSDTSRMELSRRFTRCMYKSVFVRSTEPSWFSWILYSSMLTIAPVTFPNILKIYTCQNDCEKLIHLKKKLKFLFVISNIFFPPPNIDAHSLNVSILFLISGGCCRNTKRTLWSSLNK